MTIGILMPCHSLPWRSHILHPPTFSTSGIQAWALTCEPPLHLSNNTTAKRSYQDEADIFYADPNLWLRENMSRRRPHFPQTAAADSSPSSSVLNTPHASEDHRNKKLWNKLSPSPNKQPQPQQQDPQGLDITDLLPYLRTAPDHPPKMDSHKIRRPWPEYLAFFAQLEPTMTQALAGFGYVECWRVFNSHWHDDWRRQGDIVVWCPYPERVKGGLRNGGLREEMRIDGDEEQEVESGGGEKGSGRSVVPERPGKQRVIQPGLLAHG